MGCDIHLYKEKKINGVWVTADNRWVDEYDEGVKDVPYQDRFTDRDYNLFGAIAGVRYEYDFSLKPRGLPFNVCDEVKAVSDRWGCNGHSHSYLTLTELNEFNKFLSDKTIPISGMKAYTFILGGVKQIIELFDGVDGDDHRVVFWFDN